ncbi:MAG: hydrogenase subunit MbhD domain-containing protein [Dehalococcoidia bacterium]
MLEALNVILLVALIVTALAACLLRNLLAAVFMLSAFSLVMGLVWVMLRAPDLALAEVAAIGVVSTIFFVVTISRTERREE